MMMDTVLTNQFQFMRGVGSKYISLFFYGEKSPVMYDWVKIVLSLSIKKSEFGRNLNLRESNF